MSYNKKTVSKPLDKLKFRRESAESVDAGFDFGQGMEAESLKQLESELEEAINGYNQALSDADDLRDIIRRLERKANDASDRLLLLFGGTYGKDSLEYQRMGGTRKSEIQPTGSRPETFDGATPEDSSSGTEPVNP